LLNMVMPVAVLAIPQIAIISRLTRAGMIEALKSNYVRTARAKGLPEFTIVVKHAIRAAVLPLVSYLGPAFAGLMTGSLVVERIFGLPGLGKFFVNSALQRDYTVVMGMVIFFATLILVLNLLADLLYAALDPRVRLS
jgi:oligopeptide transport system permease protein